MVQLAKVTHRGFDFKSLIQDIESSNIDKVFLYSQAGERVGEFTFARGNLLLKTQKKYYMGYREIEAGTLYSLIGKKRFSEDMLKSAGLNLKSDRGQWLLIRAEALLFNNKYRLEDV